MGTEKLKLEVSVDFKPGKRFKKFFKEQILECLRDKKFRCDVRNYLSIIEALEDFSDKNTLKMVDYRQGYYDRSN